jgi:hypothetical protein
MSNNPYIVPGKDPHEKTDRVGWNRPRTDAEALFRRVQGRDPTPDESAELRHRVRVAIRAKNAGSDSPNEMQFEAAHLRLEFFAKKLRGPRRDEVRVINRQAQDVVDAHVRNYYAHKSHSPFDFVSDVVSTAGKAVGSAVSTVSNASGVIANAISKVPVVGPGLHGAFDLTVGAPFALAGSIARGDRIDHVVLGRLHAISSDVQEVTPYVQGVVSFVPGVGSGIAGAIGASNALMQGKAISDALVAAVRGAVPGGELGSRLYDIGQGVMRGDRIETIALGQLPLPDEAKAALASGLEIAKHIASGQNVAAVLVDEAYSKLPAQAQHAVNVARGKENFAQAVADQALALVPPESRKALVTGIAIGHARNLQEALSRAADSPLVKDRLANFGQKLIRENPTLQAGASIAKDGAAGFALGTGLAAHAGVTKMFVANARRGLSGPNKRGFDLALATHVARVTRRAPSSLKTPGARAGYFATYGMLNASPSQKSGMMEVVAKDPEARTGAAVAIKSVAVANTSLWHRIKKALGLAA